MKRLTNNKNKTLCYIEIYNKLRSLEDIEEWFAKLTFYGKAYNFEGIHELKFEKFDFRKSDNILLIHFETAGMRIFYSIFDYGKTWALTKEELEK